jgi:hypothetical protein
LKDLTSKIDIGKMKEPSFMLVLCAKAPFAYRRKDGVYVVPITPCIVQENKVFFFIAKQLKRKV